MRKLYTLKKWYSLPDAANRLTLTLGEEVSEADILQLTLEGHLPLSWNMRYVNAVPVAPYCRIHDWDKTNQLNVLFGVPRKQPNARVIASEGFHILSDNVEKLEGYYIIDCEACGALKDWVHSLITGTGGELISLDGYFVKDREGNYWKIVEPFPSYASNSERKPRKEQNLSRSLNHIDNYYPSETFPTPAELGLTKEDIEAFEHQFSEPEELKTNNLPTSARERETLLKLITGMAKAWYGYDPKAARNPSTPEILSDLARVGVSVSDDTLRAKLKEGGTLLPSEALEQNES